MVGVPMASSDSLLVAVFALAFLDKRLGARAALYATASGHAVSAAWFVATQLGWLDLHFTIVAGLLFAVAFGGPALAMLILAWRQPSWKTRLFMGLGGLMFIWPAPIGLWLLSEVVNTWVLLLIAAAGSWWATSGGTVSTDNAYVRQDKVSITAEVGGQIAEVMVDDEDEDFDHDGIADDDPEDDEDDLDVDGDGQQDIITVPAPAAMALAMSPL